MPKPKADIKRLSKLLFMASRSIVFTLLFLLNSFSFLAQVNTWTWMKGQETFGPSGVFGDKGVPNAANQPPGLYECGEWKDLDGNFWVFGGLDLTNGGIYNAMWRYNPQTNAWTWMNGGSGTEQVGVYGTQGQFGANNTPGSRSYGVTTWVDLSGKFWLYGGYGYTLDNFSIGYLSEMWCFDPAINQWAWMNGPNNILNPFGEFGMLGVSSPTNYPPGTAESNMGWTSLDNLLYMYGGDASGVTQDNMWRYDISLNEWTWLSGTGVNSTTVPSYGTLNVEDPTNTPGARNAYAAFRDANNYMYFYGGNEEYALLRNDVWRYNPANGFWTWVGGQQGADLPSECIDFCNDDGSSFPGGSFELRAAAGNGCGFYLFGGQFIAGGFLSGNMNNLWYFEYATSRFSLLKGNCEINGAGEYGTQGVPNIDNLPFPRNGGSAWLDNEGNFWTFGGNGTSDFNFGNLNDMWRYVPDPNCVGIDCITSPVLAAFTTSDDEGCVPLTVTFDNNSINATSYQWTFGDGGTSSQENPTHEYASEGTFEVILIAIGEEDSDTTSMEIVVGPAVISSFDAQINSLCEPFSVELINTSEGANSYQWFLNGQLLVDPDSLIFNLVEGSYEFQLIANNEFNCPDTAVSSLSLIDCPDIFLFIPNVFTPDNDTFNNFFEIQNTGYKDFEVKIFNRWGNEVFESTNGTKHWNGKVNNSGDICTPGTYYYILQVTDFYGKADSFEGHLTLLRKD